MTKKRDKRIFNKQEVAEDWCFECKDGGELMICEYGKCLKAYHPECVGKDDSDLTSDKPWICGWHSCLICHKSSNFHCYCCKRASCSYHIGLIGFVHHKGNYGFCNDCLKLALLVEEDGNIDSDGESVDLRDRETYEGLFREYYEIVKEKEGFDKNILLAGKAQLDKEKIRQISSNSDKHSEEEDEQLSSDNGDFSDGEPQKKRLKKRRCIQQKPKKQRSVKSKKKEFVGWGSKALIDFLQFIGQDTREKLSQRDVSLIVTKYIKEHSLIDPVKKTRILCDVQLQAVFGKEVVNRRRIFSLLESHFVENEERLPKDKLDHDLGDNDTEMLVAPKTEKKVEQNKISSIWYSTAAQSQFAALIPENIKLVYLKKSLMLEMIKQPESIETKIIGSFVRVKLDPRDCGKRNSHQLVQITGVFSGIEHGSSNNSNSETLVQVSNMARDVCLTMLSDDEITQEECDELQKKVKAGLLKKLTIVELEQKAKILCEDITKHRIARELESLQNRMNHANEKGWRYQYFKLEEKRKLLLQPSYLSFKLENIPRVIPEEVELESLDRNDNKMHHCSDETTPMKQNIPGLTPEKIDLEPLSKDKNDVNQMQHCLDETTPTKKNIHGVIPEEVELEHLSMDEKYVNRMHQCLDETTPTKKNILGVIPEVELEPLAEDEDEHFSSDNGDFGDGEPRKKRLQKKRCTPQKTKKRRRVDSKKKEFVGWGSKALIDFLQFIGQDTREKLSPYDVASIVTKYAKEHTLIHPVKTRSILCDVQLEAVFGEKVVDIHRIVSLLKIHFVENEERLQKDELDDDLEDDDTEMLVAPKTEKKVEQNKISSIWYSTAARSQSAALIPDNQMHECSDETTPMKQNIPGVTPEKVELEPLSKDEKDVNQMCLDETIPTKKKILGVIPEEVEPEPTAEDERDGNKMHQCADETTSTKKNILGVIPEEVELEPMVEDERDDIKAQMRQLLLELSNVQPED